MAMSIRSTCSCLILTTTLKQLIGRITDMLSWVEWQSVKESSYNFMPKWYWNYGLRRKMYEDYVNSIENKKIDNNTDNLNEDF